ncbi:pPIWI-associating nuclease domain-containing protein, partial [Enterococcus faecium]
MTPFERSLFTATLAQFGRQDDPLSANTFAYALRELSRHVLERLAQDQDVRGAPWFVQDKNTSKVTRRQRMKFAIQGPL